MNSQFCWKQKVLAFVKSQLKYSKTGFSCLQLDLYLLFYPGCGQEVGLCTFPIPGMPLLLWIPPLPLWGKEQWCCTECRQPKKWVSIAKSRRIKRIHALRYMDFYFPPVISYLCLPWGVFGAFLSPCDRRTGRDNHSHLNSARCKSPMSASHDFTSQYLGSDSRLVLQFVVFLWKLCFQ